ncbi:hypothetical protein B0T13DRAFT_315029 [Neurospora crassa]|nr:hypothetical protein B0T13DRAFT_315029 [Neurospora crassa]
MSRYRPSPQSSAYKRASPFASSSTTNTSLFLLSPRHSHTTSTTWQSSSPYQAAPPFLPRVMCSCTVAQPGNARISMSTLAQLSAGQVVDSAIELALKFIPIIELDDDVGNFYEWEHSVRFYLDYHGLYGYIDPNYEIRCTSGPIHRHRLFVYSVVWESAKAVFPRLNKELSSKLYGNHQHDAKLLLEVLHDHRLWYEQTEEGDDFHYNLRVPLEDTPM